MADRRFKLLMVGNALWLAGIGCIVGGFSQYAWIPISWGGFALGYRYGLSAINTDRPPQTERA